MKTRFAVLGLALVSSFALAPAQADDTPANSAKPHIARMENKLGLTDEQAKQMREIRDNGGSMADMRAVLTPEQQAKAEEMMKEHKEELGERKEQLQKSLGLSDDQMSKLAEIRKNGGSREEMRAVLTPEQQAKFETLRSEHDWKGQGGMGHHGMGSAPDAEPEN